jgi:hypothetical protein
MQSTESGHWAEPKRLKYKMTKSRQKNGYIRALGVLFLILVLILPSKFKLFVPLLWGAVVWLPRAFSLNSLQSDLSEYFVLNHKQDLSRNKIEFHHNDFGYIVNLNHVLNSDLVDSIDANKKAEINKLQTLKKQATNSFLFIAVLGVLSILSNWFLIYLFLDQ